MTDDQSEEYNEYFLYLNNFFQDKIKSSLKKSFRKCASCSNDREFIITNDGELIYSCGSTSGACSQQYKIVLAKYLNYETLKNETHRFFKIAHNYSSIGDQIDLKKEIEQYKKFSDFRKKVLKNTSKTYIRNNNLKERKKTIESLHDKRINILLEQNKLKNTLTDYDDLNYKENIRKYISLSKELNLIYQEMRVITDIPIQNHITMERHLGCDEASGAYCAQHGFQEAGENCVEVQLPITCE